MKNLTLLFQFSLVLLFGSTQAAVYTVNNNSPSPGQYTTLISAYNDASNDDTIYIHGSNTPYGTLASSKRLVFIGTGHNPNFPLALGSTPISQLPYIDLNLGSEGSKFLGLVFTADIYIFFNTASLITSYENCQMRGLVLQTPSTAFSLDFKGCLFTYPFGPVLNATSSGATYTVSFNNCIFNHKVNINSTINGQMTHCLFLGSALPDFITNVGNMIFNFNIFYGTSPQITGTNGFSQMFRNLSFICPNNNMNGTSLNGNLINQDPLFTNYTPNFFKYTDNYQLQAASPGKGYALGEDIGVYGGDYNFYMGGEPNNVPVVRQVNIANPVVPAGQPLNITTISNLRN